MTDGDRWALGKVALVTGGATGLGKGCVERLAKRGANIAIIYGHSKEKALQLVKELEQNNTKAVAVQADVTDDEAVKKAVGEILTWSGNRLDILVNNAGVTRFIQMDHLDEVTRDAWDIIMNTNVLGTFQMTRACAEALKQAHGAVVNVSSIAGLMGRGSSIPYAVSKGALLTLTKAFARILAPNVRVNAVAPGVILTDWVAGQEEHIKLQTANTLLGRPAEVEDVVDAIEGFLRFGNFVTGATLVVDGGFYL
ncbi:MAG: SDR family NAD(P)-dependent oxidoreductase [Sphaerochaetaceae bacterium]|nr:SDR family NAD(P)-dependent oxidoreductase [Sphaerochaetaceae bacterium]MDX9809558.1 SDR family NAD(P)-dependent oxidoreductase [Sphaerochaetaceae bacterium]NLV85238.1 SDR family NAD(P)-dependent oxidoreductase [Spirochaetales bacterium]